MISNVTNEDAGRYYCKTTVLGKENIHGIILIKIGGKFSEPLKKVLEFLYFNYFM
jgi:hypothetical protein